MPNRTEDERAISQPRGVEETMEGLLHAGPPADPAALLDRVTFADPTVAEAMNGGGEFISHEELTERLADA